MQKYCEILSKVLRWDTFKDAHPWKVIQCDTPKGITIMCFHPKAMTTDNYLEH
jgi:hypothetical protein